MNIWERFKAWTAELFYYTKGQPGVAAAIEASAQAQDPGFVGPVYPVEQAVGDIVSSVSGGIKKIASFVKWPLIIVVLVLAGISVYNLVKK